MGMTNIVKMVTKEVGLDYEKKKKNSQGSEKIKGDEMMCLI